MKKKNTKKNAINQLKQVKKNEKNKNKIKHTQNNR